MITIDNGTTGGNRCAHEHPAARDLDMRVSKARSGWKRRVFRVMPAQRLAVVEIAQALSITAGGVAQLSLRAYAAKRGHVLPGWQDVATTRVQAFDAADDRETPRTWLHFRDAWLHIVAALYSGECRTFAGVLRESITEFHAGGADAWRAAMTTPLTVASASTAGAASR